MINNRALNYIRVAVKDAEEKFHCKLKWGCFVVGDCLVMSLRSKRERRPLGLWLTGYRITCIRIMGIISA